MTLDNFLWALNRFRLFAVSISILLVGVLIHDIVSDFPVVLASLTFGAAMAEDWYRCKYGDNPTLMFKTEEEFREIMKRDIAKYPFTKYWYKVTGHLKE